MYTFSSSMLVLHACALTFIISSTNARNKNYPVVFSVHRNAFQREAIEPLDFRIANISEVVNKDTFKFGVCGPNHELIYACHADSNAKQELYQLEVNRNIIEFGLFEKKFEDTEPKMCASKIKVRFSYQVNKSGKPIIPKQNPSEYIFNAGYMFLYTMEYVKSQPRNAELMKYSLPPAYNFCMNVDTFEFVWAYYQIANSPEPQVEDRYALSSDNEDIEYENEEIEEFQNYFKDVHEAFQNQKVKTYVPELHVPKEHLQFSLRPIANQYPIAEPIHKDLAPLMRVINKRILDYSAKFKTYLDKPDFLSVYSLTIFWDKHVQLLDEELPFYVIPHVWVKVIFNKAREIGTIIYLHNTLEDLGTNKYCLGDYQVECDFMKWAEGMEGVPELFTSQAYCCKPQPSDLIFTALPYELLMKEGFLDIDKLVVPQTPSEN